MPVPSSKDGADRAIDALAAPAVGLALLTVSVHFSHGPESAGSVLFGGTAIGLLALLRKAKYWNARYTAGFVLVGAVFVHFGTNAFVDLIPEYYQRIISLLQKGVVLTLALLLLDKLDS